MCHWWALARSRGDGVDNERVLGEWGVEMVLLGAADKSGTGRYVEDLLVGAGEVGPAIVSRIARWPGDDSVIAKAMRQAIPLVRQRDATVIVPGSTPRNRARCWRDAGADAARGPYFGPPCGITNCQIR